MRVHLVDGTFELFRAFYGAPRAASPTGREVGATRALLRTLYALVEKDGATHAGCAFDTVIESFRNRLFDGYKTGDGLDPALWSQFPLAERAAHALGFAVWPMVEFEADDALATAAVRFSQEPRVERVLVCSPDKDLAQCVRGARVVTFDRLRGTMLDEDGVRAKFGVGPHSIPDLLALVGDPADGIPGIPRWGAKSAASVLARYGRVEDIPDDEGAWDVKVRGAASLAESLRAHRDVLPLYKTLATLRVDVPLEESLADLEWRGARRDALEALCEEIGDRGFVARIARFAPAG
jgi:5'-3' exonuclease